MKKYTDRLLLKVAQEFTKGLLGNDGSSSSKCFMVSSALQGYLSFCMYRTELIKVDIKTADGICEHWILKLQDGRILDCTADQFNTPTGECLPRIYLGEMPAWYFPI